MGPQENQLKAWMIDGLDGNASSHTALLRALLPLLKAYYRRRIADPDVIEEIVQETLIAVHTRRMSFDRDRVFSAWFFAIARYKMIDHFRRNRLNCPIEDVEDLLVSPGFENEVGARLDIDELLGHLSPKQAELIRKTRIEGQSVVEAAHSTGYGESDVKVSVHRGLAALAARIRVKR